MAGDHLRFLGILGLLPLLAACSSDEPVEQIPTKELDVDILVDIEGADVGTVDAGAKPGAHVRVILEHGDDHIPLAAGEAFTATFGEAATSMSLEAEKDDLGMPQYAATFAGAVDFHSLTVDFQRPADAPVLGSEVELPAAIVPPAFPPVLAYADTLDVTWDTPVGFADDRVLPTVTWRTVVCGASETTASNDTPKQDIGKYPLRGADLLGGVAPTADTCVKLVLMREVRGRIDQELRGGAFIVHRTDVLEITVTP